MDGTNGFKKCAGSKAQGGKPGDPSFCCNRLFLFFFSFFVITSRPYTERLRMFFFLLFALANFGSNIKAAKPTDLLSELNKNTDNHGQPTFTWSTLFCPYYSHTVSP